MSPANSAVLIEAYRVFLTIMMVDFDMRVDVMSLNNQFPLVNDTLSDELNNSNNGWANFDTFDQNSESNPVTVINNQDDDWADFQSNTDDSNLPTNARNPEPIETILSTCFPLESPIFTDDFIPFELPTLTTFNDPGKQLPCFKPSLYLWDVLSSIPNDPLGVRYQWRKSNMERLFHRAIGVCERAQTKTISNVDEKENPIVDDTDDNLFEVSKTTYLDSCVPSIPPSASQGAESPITSSRSIPQQSFAINTTDLFPGSTTVFNEDPKPVVTTVSRFTFINPKALMTSIQTTHESMI